MPLIHQVVLGYISFMEGICFRDHIFPPRFLTACHPSNVAAQRKVRVCRVWLHMLRLAKPLRKASQSSDGTIHKEIQLPRVSGT